MNYFYYHGVFETDIHNMLIDAHGDDYWDSDIFTIYEITGYIEEYIDMSFAPGSDYAKPKKVEGDCRSVDEYKKIFVGRFLQGYVRILKNEHDRVAKVLDPVISELGMHFIA